MSNNYFVLEPCNIKVKSDDFEMIFNTLVKVELKDGYLIIEDVSLNKDVVKLKYGESYELELSYNIFDNTGKAVEEIKTIIYNAEYDDIIGMSYELDTVGNFKYRFKVIPRNINLDSNYSLQSIK